MFGLRQLLELPGLDRLRPAESANGLDRALTASELGDPFTDQIMLWDAGTEFNERPGIGLGQPFRQAGPNTGPEEACAVRPLDPHFTGIRPWTTSSR